MPRARPSLSMSRVTLWRLRPVSPSRVTFVRVDWWERPSTLPRRFIANLRKPSQARMLFLSGGNTARRSRRSTWKTRPSQSSARRCSTAATTTTFMPPTNSCSSPRRCSSSITRPTCAASTSPRRTARWRRRPPFAPPAAWRTNLRCA